jgi:NAD(P)-dependent dehydrogenase (short-subunit alcohol dehydrogenase family)
MGMLEGKVCVITGAGGGLGTGMVPLFVREGAKVLAVDFNGTQDKVAQAAGPGAVAHHTDLTVEAEIEGMFARTIELFGRVDGLVNLAGTLLSYQADLSVEEYEAMTAVNLRALILASNHAVRAMTPTGGGSIVNVTTAGALNAELRASVSYSAAKAGAHAATRSMASHYGKHNVRINAMASGFTLTERFKEFPQSILQEFCDKSALGRMASPEEHGEVAAFLCSDRSTYISGAIIPVDGGWTAKMA